MTATDSFGDPFALFDEPPPTPKGMRRRAPVGRCAGCRTEMIAGPGHDLPDVCTGCSTPPAPPSPPPHRA